MSVGGRLKGFEELLIVTVETIYIKTQWVGCLQMKRERVQNKKTPQMPFPQTRHL